jgi:RNA polymerase sigma-70 factor (ECF subfamily)
MKTHMKATTEEQRSFTDRVHAAQGILHRICAVYTQDKESRNDLRQEMLLQLWRSYPSFRSQSSFSTWMYRVALNTALMYRRKQKRHRLTVSIDEVSPPKAEGHSAADDEDVQFLYRCIRELPRLDRAVILMQLEQKSYREIAEVTGLSESGVSVRIVRLKQKLRTMLEERGQPGET